MHLKEIDREVRKGCSHDKSVGTSHWCIDCMKQSRAKIRSLSQKNKRMKKALSEVTKQRDALFATNNELVKQRDEAILQAATNLQLVKQAIAKVETARILKNK